MTLLLAGVFAYYTGDKNKQISSNNKILNVSEDAISKRDSSQKNLLLDSKNIVAHSENGEKLANIDVDVDSIDNIRRFFSKGIDKFDIVETIEYTSRVSWMKGRPAWIADYASEYETSRHFIARGLNGKEDYTSQNVSPGDYFNVFRKDKDFHFHILLDLSRCTLDFSYIDDETKDKVFIKTYKVGVGRKDSYSPSECLTPLGTYQLGDKIAIYKIGVENYFQNKKTHMIEIFGTRWIPFGQAIENCTDSAKGYGIHGLPFIYDREKDDYIEDISCIQKYSSDGCIRLAEKDINELFSIIITKPTYIEIVKEKVN